MAVHTAIVEDSLKKAKYFIQKQNLKNEEKQYYGFIFYHWH